MDHDLGRMTGVDSSRDIDALDRLPDEGRVWN
jgi:hypothetical protein